ncbi:Protein CBG27817 [Caenorhabditis briggsae]|uniref:Uncharacterized protein n=2 Tax=Caenorhabditis briggsae TaxID=6238 RepID=A0AAE9FLW2_CAEBR|nr:Protein CBG27817 [Caenorhabditis briggsae]ULT83183.1 hypothetical protein L3Y34_012433 [Caenorhabditis briggsae]UMM42467.1 hypothetical protein L5515_018287 [Caenorhabditis briggsae]CAS00329.1 Protein CBG27817 [Caenorhabditis briggsae]
MKATRYETIIEETTDENGRLVAPQQLVPYETFQLEDPTPSTVSWYCLPVGFVAAVVAECAETCMKLFGFCSRNVEV